MLCKPSETARRTMGKKRTARDERPYFFITRRIPCPPPALEFRKPLSTARSRPAAAPARAENLFFTGFPHRQPRGLSGRKRAFRPINEAAQSERKSGAAGGGRNAAARHERAVLFCDFPAAPCPTNTSFPRPRAETTSRASSTGRRRCAPNNRIPASASGAGQNGRRAGRPDGCALPRRSGSVAKSRIRRASGRKRRAPHRAGRRKRPQNDFAESPKASANGKNVFSFRKPAPPRGKAATAYGIRSRANAIPQARTAPVMKRLCRARRAALRRTQIGRRECFIGKPYAAGQHKRLFENAAHWHACHLRVRRMQRPTEAGRLVRALDYRL